MMDDDEIRAITGKGFGVIAGFLEDMLKIQENAELRKDFNACVEAKKILQAKQFQLKIKFVSDVYFLKK